MKNDTKKSTLTLYSIMVLNKLFPCIFSDKELNMKESRMVIPSEENAAMYTDRLGMGVPPEWNCTYTE